MDNFKFLNEKQLKIVELLNELNTNDDRWAVLKCFCSSCGAYTPNKDCNCYDEEHDLLI